MKQSKGLGDMVEEAIDTYVPKSIVTGFRKANDCGGCKRRKEKLNKFGERFK